MRYFIHFLVCILFLKHILDWMNCMSSVQLGLVGHGYHVGQYILRSWLHLKNESSEDLSKCSALLEHLKRISSYKDEITLWHFRNGSVLWKEIYLKGNNSGIEVKAHLQHELRLTKSPLKKKAKCLNQALATTEHSQ